MKEFIQQQREAATVENAALEEEGARIEAEMQRLQQRLQQIGVARIEIVGFLKRSAEPEADAEEN